MGTENNVFKDIYLFITDSFCKYDQINVKLQEPWREKSIFCVILGIIDTSGNLQSIYYWGKSYHGYKSLINCYRQRNSYQEKKMFSGKSFLKNFNHSSYTQYLLFWFLYRQRPKKRSLDKLGKNYMTNFWKRMTGLTKNFWD